MFTKGSRYRNLPESTPINARGERLRGKEIRPIPTTPGRFLHTVHEGDRLDLLAFKYYGDPTKWWQICDANTETTFPKDLLDQRPVVKERFILTHAIFLKRYDQLLKILRTFGDIKTGQINLFEEVRAREPDFLESTIVLIYPQSPSTHQRIVDEINKEFHFLQSFAWDKDGKTIEAFTFDAPLIKQEWWHLVDGLVSEPGIIEVQSFVSEATLLVVYNSAMTIRESIIAQINGRGFDLIESSEFSRIGEKIVVPPNQIV